MWHMWIITCKTEQWEEYDLTLQEAHFENGVDTERKLK